MKLLFLFPLLLLLTSCKPSAPSEKADASPGKPQVYVANYPLKYFAERLGGDAVDVRFPAPPDEDPAFWQPDDATITRYQEADLILMNGASYSKWVENTTLPDEKVVNTSAAYSEQFIEIKDATTHSHGPGGEHSHSGTAFTTWIDFNQASMQAAAVAAALKPLLPAAGQEGLQSRLAGLQKELIALDNRLLGIGKRLKGTPLAASHPVYHYLARRYGLSVEALLWEPETVPDEQAMDAFKSLLARHPAQWMLWEGQPAAESVDKLAALGVSSLVFDPCGNTPENGDFMSVMEANVKALEEAFRQP